MINSGREEIVVELSMTFDADFADLFEVKDKQLTKRGTISRRVRSHEVELSYQREDFERRTIVHAQGARLSQGAAVFLLRLAPAESWSRTLQVSFESMTPRWSPPPRVAALIQDQPPTRYRSPRPDGCLAGSRT